MSPQIINNRKNEIIQEIENGSSTKYGYETYMFLAFPTYSFWQYMDGNDGEQPHQVQSIGRFDRDKFNGDLDGLKRLWGV